MSDEHGWPDFHDPGGHDDDPGAHHTFDAPDDPVTPDDSPFHDDLFDHSDSLHDASLHDASHDVPVSDHDDVGWDDHEPGTGHEEVAEPSVLDVTDGHGLGPVGADPDAVTDLDQVSMFPPVVDVGPLPEPVDGFPWIDTGSLGLYHSGLIDASAATGPVPAEDLAAYAAQDLPPGADPWAALADSDDPATSTLAKWWTPEN